jgi:two-component system chemotaxis response regulator CheY
MKHCLVVDDSKIVRQVVRRIVEQLGFSVTEVEHGRAAIDHVRAHLTDLIILDAMMPVMDGMECMHEIRADAALTQPKIIFCTTQNEFEKIRQSVIDHADACVMKPFDEAILATKLREFGMIETAAAS